MKKEKTWLIGLLAIAAASELNAQYWSTTGAPQALTHRREHTMVFDSARGKTVLFGGIDDNGVRSNETWEFDGTAWSLIATPMSPPGRSGHAMAFDSTRNKVVMYGGNTSHFTYLLNDTWEYDGTTWTQVTTTTSPQPRYLHAMTFDQAQGRVVMFGGSPAVGALDDMWGFDGSDWTQIDPTHRPGARYLHDMVYDSARGKIVAFGGYGPDSLDDTWEFDGLDWSQANPTVSPAPRNAHAMAFDNSRNKVLLYGGFGNTTTFGDMWEFDGRSWVEVAAIVEPASRLFHAMAFNAVQGTAITFGGMQPGIGNQLADTWHYDGPTNYAAAAHPYGQGCGTSPLTLSPIAPPAIGTTGSAWIIAAPTVFSGVTMGWSHTTLAGAQILPLNLAGLGMPGCELLQSRDVVGLPTTSAFPGLHTFSLDIPNAPSLLNEHVYLQAFCLAPGQNATQVIVSNGLDWLIGN